MSVDVFSAVFAKFYYLHRKYGENVTIDKYNNIRTNPLYQDYFKKINQCKFIGSKPIGDNVVRRKRAYERFKYAVSLI